MTDFATLRLDTDTKGLKDGERDLRGVSDQAKRTAREVDSAAIGMTSAFKRVGGALAAIGATTALAGFSRASVQAAIDAQEMESAFDVVFGNMASDVRSWAEETGNALGRSTQEIQRAALAFQELFGRALDPAQSAELSKQFAVLTQDLASFKNLSNEVAQQKLFSGLVGEAEPLRAVGVFLSENALQARAAAMGLGDFSKELTDQEKIVVRAAEIQAQLAQASGDVARTSGSTANQIKTYNAAVEELQVAIGQKLLPTLTPLISAAAETVTSFAQLAQGFSGTGISLSGLMRAVATAVSGWAAYRLTLLAAAAAQGIYTTAMVAATRVIGAAQAGTIGLNAALAANPFGAVAVGIGVLTSAFVGLANAQAQARAETNNLILSLRAAAQARSADFASRRAELQGQLNQEQARLRELRSQQANVPAGMQGGLVGALTGTGGQRTTEALAAQNRVVSRLRLELDLADEAYKAAGVAAEGMVVPTAQAAAGVGKLSEEMRSGSGETDKITRAMKLAEEQFNRTAEAARRLREDTSALFDRLFPDEADFRRNMEDLGLLFEAQKAGLISPEERQRAGDQIVKNSVPEAVKRVNEAGLAEIDKVTKETERLGERTGIVTTTISESFAQMSQRITSSLQGLANSIRSGNFLGIFSGILDIFMQLGSAGVFGKSIQTNLNKPVAPTVPARQYGGQVNAGRTYLVGERGPELFTPSGHGRIVANDNMGGGMVFNIDARGATDPEAVRQQVQQGILEAAPSIVAAAEQRTISSLRRPRLAGVL